MAMSMPDYTRLCKEYVTDVTTSLAKSLEKANSKIVMRETRRQLGYDSLMANASVDDQDGEQSYTFGLAGNFQGVWHDVGDIDVLGGDSPIDVVARAVLGLAKDEELVGMSIKTKDGRIEVRPWPPK